MSSNVVISSNNPSLIAWLESKGITGDVIEYLTPTNVAHKHVYGHVPYWLAAFADRVSLVHMPFLDRTDRDRFNNGTITVQEMDAAKAHVVTYQVRKIEE